MVGHSDQGGHAKQDLHKICRFGMPSDAELGMANPMDRARLSNLVARTLCYYDDVF